VPTPTALRQQFIRAFRSLTHHRDPYEVLTDFLERAFCALHKTTLPPSAAADAIEARYMAVVRRNRPEYVRGMPELLGLTTMAMAEGGCDFLGQVTMELELPNQQLGQFFTPYELSRMMAEMTFDTADEIIAERGFVTMQEPACGAGGMIVAAADVLTARGIDIGRHLYIDGIDVSPMCFKMSYVQASLRGIPATIRRGNTLTLEMSELAVTPAFISFHAMNKDAFAAWQRGEEGPGPSCHDASITQRKAEAEPPTPEPVRSAAPAGQVRRPLLKPEQLNLFD